MHNPAPNSIILLANHAVIPAGKIIVHKTVQSRMVLWCRDGRGVVCVNDQRYKFQAGEFLIIPWNHFISYRSDPKMPMALGGVHIIPSLKHGKAVLFQVHHEPGTEIPIDEYRCRKDVKLPNLDSTLHGHFSLNTSLLDICEYLVMWYQRGIRNESNARMLSQILISELLVTACGKRAILNLPPKLRNMMEMVEKDIHLPVCIENLAQAGQCSAATVSRLFDKYIHQTPMSWVNTRKIEHAAYLLSTTTLKIQDVGMHVGIDDPYYFSRLFRKMRGMTCTKWRRDNSLL